MLRVRLLAGAWSPGAFLLALRLSGEHVVLTTTLTAVGGVAVVSMVLLLRARSSLNPQPYILKVADDQSGEVAGYLLTFVFPFVFVDVSTWREASAWGVFALVVAALVVRSDLLLLSPILLLVGYRVYKVETTTGFVGTMLSPDQLRKHSVVEAVGLTSGALKATLIRE